MFALEISSSDFANAQSPSPLGKPKERANIEVSHGEGKGKWLLKAFSGGEGGPEQWWMRGKESKFALRLSSSVT